MDKVIETAIAQITLAFAPTCQCRVLVSLDKISHVLTIKPHPSLPGSVLTQWAPCSPDRFWCCTARHYIDQGVGWGLLSCHYGHHCCPHPQHDFGGGGRYGLSSSSVSHGSDAMKALSFLRCEMLGFKLGKIFLYDTF